MPAGATVLKRVRHEACNDERQSIQYRIQLVDETLIDEAVAFMIKNFIPHENMFTTIGIHLDEEAINEAELIWKNHMSQGISFAAILEDDQGHRGPMISCNVLGIKKKVHTENQNLDDHSKISLRTEKWKNIYQTMEDIEAKGDVFKYFDCSAYIGSIGLTVASAYQRRGIAVEMLQARQAVCRMMNTSVSASLFSVEASQKAAAKCGYETLSELDLTTYRINDQIIYRDPKWTVVKWMAKRYD